MQKFRLTRTGDTPLAFEGKVVAEVTGCFQNGVELNRWHDLRLYRTEGGKFVLEVIYNTMWEGEIEHHFVEVLGSPTELGAFLPSYDATEWVCQHEGKSPQVRERRQRERDGIRSRYEERVSKLLSAIEECVEIIE